METKKLKKWIDHGFGFPVVFENVTMVKVRGEWSPKIDYKVAAKEIVGALATKDGLLTGNEVKFIRQYFEMTLQGFAERFCVSHPGVIKWEDRGNKPTSMSWGTEKDIRMFIVSKVSRDSKRLAKLYTQLEEQPEESKEKIHIDAEEAA